MNLSGGVIDYLFAFLGGVIISFSPCIYPLLPVTVGYIGINAGDSRLKGFILSLIYVTGIALTYSILGLIASFTGELFGKVSSHYITYIIVGIAITLFGLSMFELIHIPLPNAIRLPRQKNKNYLSTFVLGLLSGLLIGPCLTPALAAILAYLAAKQNIIYGMTLLFSFAYGMGTILILAGTFSVIIMRLPKTGVWTEYIKKIAAFIILVMGLYFIYTGIRRL